MTFREKLQEINPDLVAESGCPSDFGLEDRLCTDLNKSCVECWDREMPGTETETQAEQPPQNDNVSHPAHYTKAGIECIDAIEAAVGELGGIDGFLTGQVIKYIWRWKWKNGVEDLHKARWYLDRLITKQEGGNGADQNS